MVQKPAVDRRWFVEVAAEALERPAEARAALIAARCREPAVERALAATLGTEPASELEPGGALAGRLWDAFLESLGASSDGPPAPAVEGRGAGALRAGEQIGRIRLERLLSAGGMGEVYEAWDQLLERRVAVKTLRPDRDASPEARARFFREARILSQLDHPHVCRLYDLVESERGEALVLELVAGASLGERLRAEPPLADDEKLRVAGEIAAGLAAAHQRGVVHRDLKPANVVLTGEGHAKLLDFGIARREGAAPLARVGSEPASSDGAGETREGTTLGTIAYMSPEQARGEAVTPASDVFSLGLLVHELWSGRPAYQAAGLVELLDKVRSGATPPLDDLPRDLRELVGSMLALEPEARPTSAAVGERLAWIRERPARERRRRVGLLAAAAVAGLLAVASAVAVWVTRPAPLFTGGETPRLAVLPFANATGDPSLDWVEHGLAEMLSESLTSVQGVAVVPFVQVAELLAGRAAKGSATADPALLARALGASVVLETRVEKDGDGFALRYRAIRSGVAARERSLVAPDLFDASNELQARLSRRLAPASLVGDLRDRFSDDPLANRLYAMGLSRLRQELGRASAPFFEVAKELDSGFLEASARLAEALAYQSRWDDAEAEAQAVLAATAGEPARSALRSGALVVLAGVAHGRDRREEAVRFGERALAAAEEAGDADRVAAADHALGRTLRFLDPARAKVVVERARDLYRGVGNRLGEAKAVHVLGVLASEAGGEAEAAMRFEEARAVAAEIGARRLEAIALDSLSIVADRHREYERARELLDRAVALHRESGDRRALIFSLNNLGDAHQNLGRLAAAETSFAEAETVCAEVEAPNPCALLAFNYAELLTITGRPAAALPLIERSEAFYGADDPDLVFVRALHAAATGDVASGRRLLDRAVAGVDGERGDAFRREFDELVAKGR